MPNCQALSQNKLKCSKQSEDYFWFHDSHNLIDETFHLCHDHSQHILLHQMKNEDSLKIASKRLELRIKSLKKSIIGGSNVEEERKKIREAIEEGLPRPKFQNIDKLQNEIKMEYEKMRRLRELINNERNKICRWCGYSLKEPEFPEDHITGNPYSHADFHSIKGFRRETMMYHTSCGRQFMFEQLKLSAKIISFIKPRSTGQQTIFSSIDHVEPDRLIL